VIFITHLAQLKLNKYNLLYFYHPNVVYHSKLLTSFEIIHNAYKDFGYFALNVKSFPSLIAQYQIDNLPTIIFLNRKGEEFIRFNKLVSTNYLKNKIEGIYTRDVKHKNKEMERLNKWLIKWNKKQMQMW